MKKCNMQFCCRSWIDKRQLDFTANYGLKTRQVASWFWLRRGVLIMKMEQTVCTK